MKKKALSLLLVLAMVFSLCVPMAVAEDALPGAEDGVITLDNDYGTEGTSTFNLSGVTKLNLNGHKLLGKVINAESVTVENMITTQVQKTEAGTGLPLYHQGNESGTEGTTVSQWPAMEEVTEDTPAYLLGATGTFANDVSKYVADGYAAKNGGKEVFSNESNDVFNVVVDVDNAADLDESTENIVDVYADQTITVTVKVTGARFVSADVRLTWDKALFTDTTKGRDVKDWDKQENGDYRFTNTHVGDGYWEDGYVLGTFTFKAKYIDEEIVKAYQDVDNTKDNYYTKATTDKPSSYCSFTVKSGSDNETAKVIGSWRLAQKDATTAPLATANLQDDVAHIVLMDAMTGDVSAKTGLIYKATEQNLLDTTYNSNTGFSALVGGVAPNGAKVATKVYTKAEYTALGTSAPAYGDAGTKLTTEDIQGTNAGDYVVCYKISAPGYVSITGVKNVNVAKQAVDLVWYAPTGFATSAEEEVDFEGQFNVDCFSAPTATFTDLNNQPVNVTSTVTSGPNDTELKAVGDYVFTAEENPNYSFNNPTCNVKVNGLTITGWELQATNYANTGNGTDKTNGVIWRDGEERPIGYLDVADTASFKLDTSDNKYYTTGETKTEVTNVNVTYEWSEGKYYTADVKDTNDPTIILHKAGDEIWTTIDTTNAKTVAELGKYKLRMTVTADNYEKMVQIVNFEIKNPIFVVENLEYVPGYSIVLVYTNETGVAFRYDNTQMYDVSAFGYTYNDNHYGNSNESANKYLKVYATVIEGAADVSKVYASNNAALELQLPADYINMMPTGDKYIGNEFVNDVNNKIDATVDLDDVTAIQSIYNVNAGNMNDMQLVLRADVNRDKQVDTYGDVSQARAFYIAH